MNTDYIRSLCAKLDALNTEKAVLEGLSKNDLLPVVDYNIWLDNNTYKREVVEQQLREAVQ